VDIHEEIQFFLYKESVLMNNPFDAFFDKSAIEARKQKQVPTEAEELAAQGRSDVLLHLTDFASVWPRPEITEIAPGVFEGGVKEVNGPTSTDLQEYRAAQEKSLINVSGDFGGVWMDTNSGSITFNLSTVRMQFVLQYSQFQELLAALNSLPRVAALPSSAAPGYAPQVPGVMSAGNKSQTGDHFPSQNELVFAQSSATRENEERAQYSIRMQRESGIWGSSKRDGR